MTKRMLIDASHAEETRVVVLDGNRLEDFDVETQSRRQLKGNIYLAKVVRVEPSLQAAFVEYGGNRHGFLAFGEIHPDYYQIPVADRQRLLAMQEEEARAEEEAEDEEPATVAATEVPAEPDQAMATGEEIAPAEPETQFGVDTAPEASEPAMADDVEQPSGTRVRQVRDDGAAPENLGGEQEQAEEQRAPRSVSRFMRSYKIQEVIRRRQILLIQVVKEERGTKGAALTTYISLAGRYCVLMPNSPRGGGISRKITSASDRRRLKEVTAELDIPRGMGLIVRTAGAMRPKPEVKRDGEYLLRLWDDIRERTMQSMAPALIHEEATLIKRAIRDVYSRDVDDLIIDGEDGWRAAREFMRMLMPTHVKKVQLWPQGGQPLFAHSQVESMLDSMLNPTVQLRSGGYLVINQTEALVAIDVNSGRSTRERGIEETALRTNLEAAEEAARQLRLRDLAGLIVIDFIDMESKKHNSMVERRMAEALKNDRARIQIGHISHFGLMELSRQRLRPSLAETSLTTCAHCGGTGHVRSTESAALHVLREIEEEGGKQRAAEICVHVAGVTALYILNHKRERLGEIEQRYRMQISFAADETLLASQTRIEKLRAQVPGESFVAPPVARQIEQAPEPDEMEEEPDVAELPAARVAAVAPDPDAVPGETAEEGEQRRRRRRRRRRGGRREDPAIETAAPLPVDAEQPDIAFLETAGTQSRQAPADADQADVHAETQAPTHAEGGAEPAPVTADFTPRMTPEPVIPPEAVPGHDQAAEAEAERAQAEEPVKKRSRGGRRRRKPEVEAEPEAETVGAAPYSGPTPADPFAGGIDIFDVMDRFETVPTPVMAAAQPAPNGLLTKPDPVPEPLSASPVSLPLSEPKPQPVPEAAAGTETESAPPAGGAVIQPVLVGASEPAAEKKRGWWRR